ncbi:MAG: spore germination protein GerW family protein [Phycisphaeraceae bacterium]
MTRTDDMTQAHQAGADTHESAGHGQRMPFLTELAERLEKGARAAAIFGEPVEREGVTVVPVARARWGLGGGASHEHEEDEQEGSSGGGGGVNIAPVGYIEMRGGETRFRWIATPGSIVTAVIGGLVALLLLKRILR